MPQLWDTACHSPAWQEELASPTLASGSLCTHSPILLWEGSILQVPPPHASFPVWNVLLVEGEGAAASSASSWLI